MMKFQVFIIAFFSLFIIRVNAQSGEELFKSSCSSCHTINKGRLVGPDLAGVQNKRNPDWLKSFIRSSQQMIKSGDPDAVAIFNEFNKVPMPDHNLSDEQIQNIIGYISQSAPGPSVAAQKSDENIKDSTAVAGDSTIAALPDTVSINEKIIRSGRSYYNGDIPFANGGAPCISCHNINDGSLLGGGKLAVDLTASFTRLGPAGITAILANPPFPVMKAAFPGVLTEEEIPVLVSLLKAASLNIPLGISFPRGMILFVLAFVIAIFIAALTFLLYDDRKIPEGNVPDNKNSG
ncbi:MAG TPA: c-type cytochrome [Bacteroidales bacterium]|nr:c-type cytochrome [Bacteroidales bacterium]